MTTPAFRRERRVDAVEQRQIDERDDEVASRLDELDDVPSRAIACDARMPSDDSCPIRRFDECRRGRLALQARRQVGEQLEIVEDLLRAAENVS